MKLWYDKTGKLTIAEYVAKHEAEDERRQLWLEIDRTQKPKLESYIGIASKEGELLLFEICVPKPERQGLTRKLGCHFL